MLGDVFSLQLSHCVLGVILVVNIFIGWASIATKPPNGGEKQGNPLVQV